MVQTATYCSHPIIDASIHVVGNIALTLLYTLTLILIGISCLPLYESCLNVALQSFINSGDYDDPDDYPDLAERLEAYKRELAYYWYKYDIHLCCIYVSGLQTTNSLVMIHHNIE